MKFLQTGDWHLGKSFYEFPLLDDQRFILDQIQHLLQQAQSEGDPYDALIVPGDIYDRAVPPSEATALLSTFITSTHEQFPSLELFFLAGNHDSAERLSFAKDLLQSSNIHLCTDYKQIATPVIVKDCAVYQLPFLQSDALARTADGPLSDTPLRTQQELLDQAVLQITQSHQTHCAKLPAILCAHLFAAGGTTGDSERIPVGTAEQIDARSLSFFSYTALGHLHSFQKAGEHAYYSGSPLSYSFAESDNTKYVLSVTVTPHGSDFTKQLLTPLHPCTTLTASFDELVRGTSFDIHRNDYLQVVCTDRVPVSNPMAQLRKKFPFILSFSYQTASASETSAISLSNRKTLVDNASLERLYDAYLADLYGKAQVEADPLTVQKRALFKKFCNERSTEESV